MIDTGMPRKLGNRVRRFAAAALLGATLVLPATGVMAMWAGMSEAELVDGSEIIVTAEIEAFETLKLADGSEVTAAVLKVSETLKGSVPDGTVYLKVLQPGAPVSSSSIVFRDGQSGLWFLRALDAEAPNYFAADHPQRFVAADQAPEALKLIRDLLP